MTKITLFLISLYQKTLSPDKGLLSHWLKGRVCSHEPHCSEYAKECFQKYSFFHALDLTFERVMSCTPSAHKTYQPSSYRVVFCSGAPIGVPFLHALENDPRMDLVGVVTMPDAPSGRGMKLKENIIKKEVKKFMTDHTGNIVTPRSLRTRSKKHGSEAKAFKKRLQEKEADFLVVVAYGKIIPQEILDIPRVGPINVHGSLLPKYRGASPLQSAFLHGEKETGVTVMLMNDKLDEGEMIHKLTTKIPLSRTVKDLISRIETHSPVHLLDTLRSYGHGDLKSIPQDHTQATLCRKIQKEDGLVDPYVSSLGDIYRIYQAYAVRPKTYFIHNNKRVIIEQIDIDEEIYQEHASLPLIQSNMTPNRAVTTLRVKPEGKKSMERDAFMRGYLTG